MIMYDAPDASGTDTSEPTSARALHPHDVQRCSQPVSSASFNPPLSLPDLIKSEEGLRGVTPRIASYLPAAEIDSTSGTRGALFLSEGSVVNFAGDVIVNAANTR